jgi:spore coat protein U-like protein
MTSRWISRAALLLALACAAPAWAAITCTVSSPGWSAAYVPANPGFTITQSQITVECKRNLPGDGTSVAYNIQVNNGTNATGNANRLRLGATGNYLTYENYRDSTCGGLWKQSTPQRVTGTITGLSGFLPTAQVTSFWGCIDGGQLGGAAGVYTDLVTMTITYPGGSAIGTFPISVYSPASCTVTNPPGTITFNYTAFGPAVNASTPFGVTCTNQLPYTMALDATADVVLGLQYTLSFSTASAVGTGVQQNHSINGVMPAGQAGTCAGANCSGNQVRTLTITY